MTLGKFANFLYPTLPVSFEGDTKSALSLLSGAYARGSKRSHTADKGVTIIYLVKNVPTPLIKNSVKVKCKAKVFCSPLYVVFMY